MKSFNLLIHNLLIFPLKLIPYKCRIIRFNDLLVNRWPLNVATMGVDGIYDTFFIAIIAILYVQQGNNNQFPYLSLSIEKITRFSNASY